MGTVRFYIQQDNRTWSEEVPFAERLERQADLEMTGATVYHATLIQQNQHRKPDKPRIGVARHLFA